MHVISRKALRQFWEHLPDSKTALARWFKIVQQTEFHNFKLRAAFFRQPTKWTIGLSSISAATSIA